MDLLLWCFGPVRRVFGKTATSLHAIEAEDTAVAVLEFMNGALGDIEATTAAFPGYARRLELTGSEGTAILDGDRLVSVDLRGGELERARRRRTPAAERCRPRLRLSSPTHRRISVFSRISSTRVRQHLPGVRRRGRPVERRRDRGNLSIGRVRSSGRPGVLTLVRDMNSRAHRLAALLLPPIPDILVARLAIRAAPGFMPRSRARHGSDPDSEPLR